MNEAVEPSLTKDETTDGGETAGETSEEERPVTATLRRASGKKLVFQRLCEQEWLPSAQQQTKKLA